MSVLIKEKRNIIFQLISEASDRHFYCFKFISEMNYLHQNLDIFSMGFENIDVNIKKKTTPVGIMIVVLYDGNGLL